MRQTKLGQLALGEDGMGSCPSSATKQCIRGDVGAIAQAHASLVELSNVASKDVDLLGNDIPEIGSLNETKRTVAPKDTKILQ